MCDDTGIVVIAGFFYLFDSTAILVSLSSHIVTRSSTPIFDGDRHLRRIADTQSRGQMLASEKVLRRARMYTSGQIKPTPRHWSYMDVWTS